MNDIQIFKNKEFGEIRVVDADGTPWFVGKDVATTLGYKDTINALKAHVDEDDKKGWQINTPSRGSQNATVINESGLYSLILSSKLPKAKKFKHWVTSEVLPSIRKTGGYVGAKEDDSPEVIMAKALQIANNTLAMQKDRIGNLEGAVKLLEPDAKYARETLTSKNTWNTNVVAKEFGMSAVTLNQHLKQLGIQYKQHGVWVLSAKYQDKGYTKTSTYKYVDKNGSVGTRIQMEWTEKGRRWLHELHDDGKF